VIVHSLVPNAQNMRHHLSELGVVSHLYKPTTSLATLSRAITALQPV
jgi:hypothetical protein